MDIIQQLQQKVTAGTVIPKPDAKRDFVVKGWGKRRKEDALIYQIPNHINPDKPYEKGINVSEWRKAYKHIADGGIFDRDWFSKNMDACAKEGGCNFTSIGGIFQLLGLADYEPGAYKSRPPARK